MNFANNPQDDFSDYAYHHSAELEFADLAAGLCKQVEQDSQRDPLLSRMDKLRALANKQKNNSRWQSRRQTSFGF